MTNKVQTLSDLPGGHPADNKQEGPTPAGYVRIGVILLVITLLELASSFLSRPPLNLPEWLQVIVLLALATIKGSLVVSFFMHLRFDSRWFLFLFGAGMFLAVFAVVAFLVLFTYRAGLVA